MLKNLSKLYKAILPFEDFLYILQLEEYDNMRYISRIPRFFFRRNLQVRDTLKFTSRIQTTYLLAFGIFILSLPLSLLTPPILVVSPLLIPLYVGLANNLLTPFYEFMKLKLQKKAAQVVKSKKNLKIIAIAGSYGKTTTKNFLYELIRFNKRTQMVPGNINTPTGIAAWVMKELNAQTEILLVEMDSYFIGEIARSCMVTTPDIAIITSIGDQHIERFGSVKKMAQAIVEVFTHAKPTAHYFIFDAHIAKLRKLQVKIPKKITVVEEKETDIKTNVTSHSTKIDLHMAINVAQMLNIPKTIIVDTARKLTLPDRRQKPVTMYGYDAIDDSYNISATTAREGIMAARLFAKAKKKKLLVITAGIPELGPDNIKANGEYGKYLAKNADAVIVLNSIFLKEIMQPSFEIATNFSNAWEVAKKYSPRKYVVLVQPELTDLYY